MSPDRAHKLIIGLYNDLIRAGHVTRPEWLRPFAPRLPTSIKLYGVAATLQN